MTVARQVNKLNTYRRTLVRAVSRRRPGFEPGLGQVGLVVDKAALGADSSDYFGFPCQTFHWLFHSSPRNKQKTIYLLLRSMWFIN
jgi:hypothetical protein